MTDSLAIHPTFDDDFQAAIGLHMVFRSPDHRSTQLITGFQTEPMDEMHIFHAPVAWMTREDAQWLVNWLWEVGIRHKAETKEGELAVLRDQVTYLQSLVSTLVVNLLETVKKQVKGA